MVFDEYHPLVLGITTLQTLIPDFVRKYLEFKETSESKVEFLSMCKP